MTIAPTEAAARPPATVLAPPGGVFRELAETLLFGLHRLGYDAAIVSQPSEAVGRTIVIGGFTLSAADAALLPPDAIIYNTEHFSYISQRAHYMALLGKHPVWDYNQHNADRLVALLDKELRYVPLGFVPELARIPKAEIEDIDVLFYGSHNDRRGAILNELRRSGLNAYLAPYRLFGLERDALIARAKVVINIHFYEPGAFEIVRVSYLLANRKAVVSELNPGEFLDPDLTDAVRAVPYGQLVEACNSLVSDHDGRRALEESGFRAITARDEAAILRQAFAPIPVKAVAHDLFDSSPVPRRLNLGSGKDWRASFLNVDLDPRWSPDLTLDICDPDLSGREFPSKRFGDIRLETSFFDEIIALDVLEHVTDLTRAMTNCLSLLREGGVMRIHVPYDLSFGAWQDPTHVRAFNERSWWYYCQWFWYLGWTTARFDLISLDYGFSQLGRKMQQDGVSEEEIARTPRATDQMRVLLRKRPLTSEEQALGEQMRGEARHETV